jgi:hypothetical protein
MRMRRRIPLLAKLKIHSKVVKRTIRKMKEDLVLD